jgi:DNA-directed RNA polymerase specialized sigma24 family protein
MQSKGSVSWWIGDVKEGDAVAAQKLWERYFRRLVGLARKQLQGRARGLGDEEDVALSAFASFYRNAAAGRFPQLADRDDLWRLLVVITARKASHLVRDERRLKRGGMTAPERGAAEADVEQVLGQAPSPAVAALVAEEVERLLARLDDAELQSVALWKMEGYTTPEIADKLGYAPRTVERKLELIRTIWRKEGGP